MIGLMAVISITSSFLATRCQENYGLLKGTYDYLGKWNQLRYTVILWTIAFVALGAIIVLGAIKE